MRGREQNLCDELFQRKNAGEKDLIIQRGKLWKRLLLLNLHLPVHLQWTPPEVWKIVTRMGKPYFLLLAAPSGPNPDFSINSSFNCTNFRRTVATCKSMKCWCTNAGPLLTNLKN